MKSSVRSRSTDNTKSLEMFEGGILGFFFFFIPNRDTQPYSSIVLGGRIERNGEAYVYLFRRLSRRCNVGQ